LRDMEGLTDEEVAEITGLRSGTVRVRLHRARLFVRKELVKTRNPHPRRSVGSTVSPNDLPKPARCKAMFAELSNYLDEQLDDSLCDELEKHMGGCQPCKAFLASLESTILQCRTSPAEHPATARATSDRKKLMKNYARVVATLRP